jgi:hypothetical protein
VAFQVEQPMAMVANSILWRQFGMVQTRMGRFTEGFQIIWNIMPFVLIEVVDVLIA